MKKKIIILRGTSGSGKSSIADAFCLGRETWRTVSADDFFLIEGEYKFDFSLLGKAHEKCRENFLKFINDPLIEGIVVSNTNTRESEWSFYKKEAEENQAEVYFIVVEKRHENENIHDIPWETIDNQEKRIKSSLKLK